MQQRLSGIRGDAFSFDQRLVNPWGAVVFGPGDLWINDNRRGVATHYLEPCRGGVCTGPEIEIPAPAGVKRSSPTGMVTNADHVFAKPGIISGVSSQSLIFATEDGTISIWDPTNGSTAVTAVDNSHGGMGAVYKGLARGTNNLLFATNFRAGTVETYDRTFTLVTQLPGPFTDPDLPTGYAPFGIANIDGDLFVTYARQNATKNDVVKGAGKGIVDIFNDEGIFVRRFASGGTLNAPWGIIRAPYGFGQFGGDILIGNFGDGRINAFGTRGRHLGALRGLDGHPIVIEGLWSLFLRAMPAFEPAFDPDRLLYFTAGLGNETMGPFGSGLFGYLTAVPRGNGDADSNDDDQVSAR